MKRKVINSAITVQEDIVVRLHAAHEGRAGGHLDLEEIGNFYGCVLGQWLSTHPELFADVNEYLKIQALHRVFHQQAAEVAKVLNSNRHLLEKAKLKKVVDLSRQLAGLLRKAQQDTPSSKSINGKDGHHVGWSSIGGMTD